MITDHEFEEYFYDRSTCGFAVRIKTLTYRCARVKNEHNIYLNKPRYWRTTRRTWKAAIEAALHPTYLATTPSGFKPFVWKDKFGFWFVGQRGEAPPFGG